MRARSYKGFYPKTGAWEGAEHLLTQLVALPLSWNISSRLLFYSSRKGDVKPLVFRDGTPEAESKEKHGVWDPAEVDYNLTLCSIQIRLQHIYHG